jgi:capsid protein
VKEVVRNYFDTGVLHFSFGREDDATLFESNTPASEFQSFMTAVIQEALISLDIPLNFMKPDLTNFYGSRGALDDYIDSCMSKQEGLINALHEITDWRLRMAIADGELPPPPNGMTVDDMLWFCDWVGTRIPIHRLIEDCKGYVLAAQAGFVSPQTVCGIFGQDHDENIDELAEFIKLSNAHGVPSTFAQLITTTNLGM